MIKLQRVKRDVYVTDKGLTEAKFELGVLKKEKRSDIAQRIQRAREFGDLSENSEYDAALEEQSLVESRIAELEELVKNAEVITEVPKTDLVVIGSTILLDMDGQRNEFTIVGRVEANPSLKRISNESPLGSTVLGAKIGEELEVKTPAGSYRCKVLAIK